MITIKDVEAAWDIIRTADSEAASISSEIKLCEDQQQDILHELELECPAFNERAKLAQRLGKVRRTRRVLKNRYETLQPLLEWINSYPDAAKQFGTTLGKMRKAEEIESRRLYMCRGDERGRIIGGKK